MMFWLFSQQMHLTSCTPSASCHIAVMHKLGLLTPASIHGFFTFEVRKVAIIALQRKRLPRLLATIVFLLSGHGW